MVVRESGDAPVEGADTAEAEATDEEHDVTDGRYLYCLVDTGGVADVTLAEQGVDDEPVQIVESGTVGAVVHECDGIYDTDDPETMRSWVLAHQRVVDTAAERFGTPLPMRFDTVLEGGDDGVRDWVAGHQDRIREALERFAGTWEYRIHLRWDSSRYEQEVAETDDRLQEIEAERTDSDEGASFLLEKQYEQRLRELNASRRDELETTLLEAVEPVVEECIEQDAVPSSLAPSDDEGPHEPVTRLAVLARGEREGELGNRLDDVVERDGVEITFTGPWPPYTFAPDLG